MSLTLPGKIAHPVAGSGFGHKIWDREEVRHRFAEAAATIRRLPLPKNSRPAHFKTAWPDVCYDWLAYGWMPTRSPRIPPTPYEITRMDEVLDWLHLLTRDQRLILWARANHWSWPKIMMLDDMEQNGKGRGQRQLRNIADDGEARVLSHLNGTPRRMVLETERPPQRAQEAI